MKVSSVPARACALLALSCLVLIAFLLSRSSASSGPAQELAPMGELRELAIDDGEANCILGFPKDVAQQQSGLAGFGWVNKLTPATYPATLRSITVGFNRTDQLGNEVRPNAIYRVVVLKDSEKDGPANGQKPDATFIGRVRGTDPFMTFNLISPLTITEGSFVVGVIDEAGGAGFPALFDVPGKSNPPGTESFLTTNGGLSWRSLAETQIPGPNPCNAPGSWLIRATIETGEADVLSEASVTKIKDPLAVEPWAVAAGATQSLVTNYVSDNVTIFNTENNTLQNLPVGDGPAGTPDGPFGVVIFDRLASRAFVTLFGSNTIPSKEFPVDYSTVGPGRVAVLTRQADGAFTQSLQISVGKGPRFPALVGSKLYVPCGGANRVDVIDTASNLKIKEIPVGLDPSSCTAAVSGPKLYVTNFGDGSVSVIDTRTDTKIKDIPAPHVPLPKVVDQPLAANPWQAAASLANGNLYVTYWGTVGDVAPNGAIVEIDTCKDEVVRVIFDDTTRGTPAASAGAAGIPAPTAPLTRDAASGTTLEAGGGGGGPFGIAQCQIIQSPTVIFTNDGLGIIGVLDSRIDQVVSAPPLAIASCPKPRGVACVAERAPLQPRPLVFVACGQPENALLVFKAPALRENIAGLPLIQNVKISGKLKIEGLGFSLGARVEVIDPATGACIGFDREPKIKSGGTVILQKGRLTDGRKPKDDTLRGAFLRVINPDGSVRLVAPSP